MRRGVKREIGATTASDSRRAVVCCSQWVLMPRSTVLFSLELHGELRISAAMDEDSMKKMGVIMDRVVSVGGFAEPQGKLLKFHRTNVFFKSEVSKR